MKMVLEVHIRYLCVRKWLYPCQSLTNGQLELIQSTNMGQSLPLYQYGKFASEKYVYVMVESPVGISTMIYTLFQ